jgi:ABC-2 type transport system ATP-binding protein
VQTGTLDELRYLTRTTVDAVTDRPVSALGGITGVHHVSHAEGHVRFDVDGPALGAAIAHLSTFGIRSLVSQPPTLEELFLRHYGDELAAMAVDIRDEGAPA